MNYLLIIGAYLALDTTNYHLDLDLEVLRRYYSNINGELNNYHHEVALEIV